MALIGRMAEGFDFLNLSGAWIIGRCVAGMRKRAPGSDERVEALHGRRVFGER